MTDAPALSPAPLGQKILFLSMFVIVHGLTVYALIFNLNSPFLATNLALLLVFYLLTGFAIEGSFHRLTSHRAFEARPWLYFAMSALGSMAAQGPVLAWAANHRRHHMYSDAEGDPHSPVPVRGGVWSSASALVHAHFGWYLTVAQSSVVRFAPDLLLDRTLLFINQSYWLWVALGLVLPGAIGYAVHDSWRAFAEGVLWGGVVRICLVQNMVWAINSLAHRYGRRAFEVPGESRNIFWLALPSLGSAWHNNHHAFPKSVTTSRAWWQLDITGLILGALKAVGLVKYPASTSPTESNTDKAASNSAKNHGRTQK